MRSQAEQGLPTKAPLSRERMPLQEKNVSTDDEDARQSLEQMQLIAESRIESLGIERRFHSVKQSLKILEVPYKAEARTEAETERFAKHVAEIAVRLQPQKQVLFLDWVKAELAKDTSLLSRELVAWKRAEIISAQVEKIARSIVEDDFIPELQRMELDVYLVNRVRVVVAQIGDIQTTHSLDKDAIFEQFFIDEAQRRASNPGFWRKAFGTSVKKELDESILDYLSPEWGSEKPHNGQGPSRKDILEGALKNRFDSRTNALKKTSGKDKPLFDEKVIQTQIKKIHASLDGTPEVFAAASQPLQPKGLESFLQNKDYDPRLRDALESLHPILGSTHLVKAVHFINGPADYSLDTLGNYGNDRIMSFFHPPSLNEGTFFRQLALLRVMAHETGHAMRIEEVLPLSEALTYNVRLRTSIEVEGYITDYSQHAKEQYKDMYGKAATVEREKLKKTPTARMEYMGAHAVTESGDLYEEWAEIVAHALFPMIVSRLSPYKQALAHEYLAKYGVSLVSARETLKKCITLPDSELMMQAALKGDARAAIEFVRSAT